MKKLQILIFIAMSACSDKQVVINEKVLEKVEIKSRFSVTEVLQSNDSIIIKGACAVLFSPDSIKINHLKSLYGEDNFYILTDDNLWYLSEARQFLQSKKIRIVETEKERIQFIQSNGRKIDVNISNTDTSWGYILFDGKKEPIKFDLIEIVGNHAKYFDNQ